MKTLLERRTDLQKAIGEMITHLKSVQESVDLLTPYDVASAEPANDALAKLEQATHTTWEALASIYFPVGARMRLHLRSETKTTKVEITGYSFRSRDINFLNIESDKFNGIYIDSLLKWGSLYKTDPHRATRIAQVNRQLHVIQ